MKNGREKVRLVKAIRLYAILGAIFSSVLFLNSCKDNSEDFVPYNQNYINQLPVEPLSETERASLVFMREEEKLARDVYTYLYTKWNILIFNNIASSEQAHTDAVLVLLNKYGISDPVENNGMGIFTNPDLQRLYTDLTQQGSVSLLNALLVGATIEDLDISDLNSALLSVDNADIEYVYDNLNKGSRNHLRSFFSQIQIQNGTYEAQFISQDEFDEIVNSPIERGGF